MAQEIQDSVAALFGTRMLVELSQIQSVDGNEVRDAFRRTVIWLRELTGRSLLSYLDEAPTLGEAFRQHKPEFVDLATRQMAELRVLPANAGWRELV